MKVIDMIIEKIKGIATEPQKADKPREIVVIHGKEV